MGARVRKETTRAPRCDSLFPRLCQVNLDFMFTLETKLCLFNITQITLILAQYLLLLTICATIFSATQLEFSEGKGSGRTCISNWDVENAVLGTDATYTIR